MEGQWLARFAGGSAGTVVIDIDEFSDRYEGHAHIFDHSKTYGVLARLIFPSKAAKQSIKVYPVPLDAFGNIVPMEVFRERLPTEPFPQQAVLDFEERARILKVTFDGDGGKNTVSLRRSDAAKKSKLRPNRTVKTWDKYKRLAVDTEPDRFIFRGQPGPHRLRTAFHRTQRKDLTRFVNFNIPDLHRAICARTKHYFELSNSMQNGAFWNLIQHHGYPTPLLDWSHSPFVAAFFGFQNPRADRTDRRPVRILMFDRLQWVTDFKQIQVASAVQPHFSILEALALENERAVPQQALSSLTNVDDIETYIAEKEAQAGKRYLQVFDLPYGDRNRVLQELRLMGITSGSIYPGLDGICRDFRDRHFGIRE